MTPSHLFTTDIPRLRPWPLFFVPLLVLPLAAAGQYPAASSPALPTNEEGAGYAQDEVPAHLALVDGAATLEREGRVEEAVDNLPLLAGDRLRTARGRVEILFADGSAVDLDEYSDVDLLSDSLMRLLAGRVRISIARSTLNAAGETSLYRVDSPAGSVLMHSAGDYQVALVTARGEPEIDLAVWRGTAELQNAFGRTLVRAGMHAYASTRGAPSLPYGFNSAAWDAFDRWIQNQRDARYGVNSARYLPADLRYHGGTFDRYGTWAYEPAYGQVWYPRVDLDWRPYYAGRWSFFARFGWFWIGLDRWSWPTHHYGRWGLGAGNRWFWVPGRRWAPAWVSWGYAPGYVSWCPLGINGYPVVSVTSLSYSRGWSILPSHLFAHNVIVPRHVVDSRFLTPSVRAAWTVRPSGPAWRDAVGARPLRGPVATIQEQRRPGNTVVPRTPSSDEYRRPANAVAPDDGRQMGRWPSAPDDGRQVGRRSSVPYSRPAQPTLPGPPGQEVRRPWNTVVPRSPSSAEYRRPANAVAPDDSRQLGRWPSAPDDGRQMGRRALVPDDGRQVGRRASVPYSRPAPQDFGTGRELPRAVPRVREPGGGSTFAPPPRESVAPPRQHAPAPGPPARPPRWGGASAPPHVAAPSRPRPAEPGGSTGRAVRRN